MLHPRHLSSTASKEVCIKNFVIRNFVNKKVCILRNFVIKEVCTQKLCNKGSLYQEHFRNFVIKEVCTQEQGGYY